VKRWVDAVRPRVIVLENVEEFADWGPLTNEGLPCPRRAGQTFRAFVGMLRRAGYKVEHRMLVAADYGAPTTRKRLFLIARRDGHPIVWPEPTHGRGRAHPWRTAAEIIDWSIPCPSIFERARPYKPATLARIAKGVHRYVVDAARPFVIPVTHPRDARVHSIDEPLRTVTAAHRGEFAVVTPFVSSQYGCSVGRPASAPLPTVTAGGGGHQALVVPTLIQTGYGERPGQEPRVPGLEKPLGTVVAGGAKHALVAAMVTKHYGGVVGHEVERSLGAITTRDHHAVTAAFLTKFYGTSTGSSCSDPVPTVTAGGGHLAAVQALLERHAPERTLFDGPTGLVTIEGELFAITDIGMRMLQPRELFRAQGFPDSYVIDLTRPTDGKPFTKENQIALAGNAVPPQLSEAIVAANLGLGARAEALAAC
jgi:DNA (cytosine-5)-methyltransferase 1